MEIQKSTLKTIYLYGRLKEFGDSFQLDVNEPAEAIRALSVQLPNFREAIASGQWHIVRGSLDEGIDINESDLRLSLGGTCEIHILPAAEGAGGKFGQIILGAVLIGAAFWAGAGAPIAEWGAKTKLMGQAGLGLAVNGVSSMLTRQNNSNYSERETADNRPSFMFSKPINTSTQGLPVPLIYGEVIVGSVVISAGMNAEDIPN